MDDRAAIPGPGAPEARPSCRDPLPPDQAPPGGEGGTDPQPLHPGASEVPPGPPPHHGGAQRDRPPDSPPHGGRRNIAWELDQTEASLADAEIAEIRARGALDWERAKFRIQIRDRDVADNRFPQSSDDVDARVIVAMNEGPLKSFYDSWIEAKAQRIAIRKLYRQLERANRRETYGTL